MRHDAISGHERGSIIRILNERGTWTVERKGAVISMAQTKPGGEIQYAVTMGRGQICSARTKTVAEAVEDINRTIRGRRPEPMAGREGNPNGTGQGRLIRLLRRSEEETAMLWGES